VPDIHALIDKMNELEASDLIVKVGNPPAIKVNGELQSAAEERLTPDDTKAAVRALVTDEQWSHFEEEMELDFAYPVPGVCRLRANVFMQRGATSLVLRRIPNEIPTLESLGLPDIARDMVLYPRGLLLVTGPAGSGKSTTQAAMIAHRNASEECHIITIEDPIEYVHHDALGLINQREVGRDTESFTRALKSVLRQDPDVILVGEMRDLETVSLTITASETGHLALGTLHTFNAAQTVDRIINVFPSHQQQQVRMQLAVNLIGVISQSLLRKADGSGRVAAFEVMVATSAIRNMIRDGKTHQIPQAIQMGTMQGMISLEKSLSVMVKKGIVNKDDALSKSSDPNGLEELLQV